MLQIGLIVTTNDGSDLDPRFGTIIGFQNSFTDYLTESEASRFTIGFSEACDPSLWPNDTAS